MKVATGQAKAGAKVILVVADERIVARDLQRTLVDLGYSVPATASSSEQALLLAAEQAPDLVLMDARLTGAQDGIATAALLRERFDVPIVYLLEPFTTNELRCAIEMSLFKHETSKELRDRERWLIATMGAMVDGVISTDAGGRVKYMNSVAERLTGWACAEARDRPVDEVLRLRDQATSAPDGRLVASRISPILADDGGTLGAVMVFRDLSQQRKLQRKLEMSDRLATVGTMAAGVAHEVNNPLAYVLTSVQWGLACMRRQREGTGAADASVWMDEVVVALADAEVGVAHVVKIVRDLNAFTRLDTEPTEPVQLNEVIEWSLDVAGAELRPRTRVVRRFGDPPLIMASTVRLGQVFVNLLVNAAQALDPSRFDANEIVVSTGVDDQGRAVVEIRDNGCGMSPEVMDRAFEPFFTTKPVGKGTGLGLSICHEIAESLGGTIVFDSERGKGTLARVSLPAGRLEPALPVHKTEPRAGSPIHQRQ